MQIVEVSPRDGLQNEARALPVATRAELIGRLLDAGARRIEVAAFVRPDRVPQMAGAEELLELLPRADTHAYAGLVANERGLERALSASVDEVNVVVPCTDEMSLRNQGVDVQAMLGIADRIVAAARAAGLPTTVTAAVAFGCPFSGEVAEDAVSRVVEAAATAGATEIAIADTIGVGVPAQVRRLAALARDEAPGRGLRFHFHNTRNTGYANAVAAWEAGADALDSSVGGFGGCPFAPAAAGNIATEDLVYLMHRSGEATGLDLPALRATAGWLGEALGSPVPGMLSRSGEFPARQGVDAA